MHWYIRGGDGATVGAVPSIPEEARENLLSAFGKRYVRHLKRGPTVPKNKVRIKSMAASTTSGFPIPASAQAVSIPRIRIKRRRHISQQAGRALEILGHAIEYLTDEFIHQGVSLSAKNEQLEAVQLLMALNRQVYFECPEVPTFGERCRALLHFDAV
jgi:hypothetical protein